MNKGRILWIDVAKVIGIFLMIIGHIDLIPDRLGSFIYSYHMPLFFVISGIFWHPLPFKEIVKKNFRALIVPFLIMTAIWCLYYFVCYIKNGIHLRQLLPYIFGSIISPGKDFMFMHPLCINLWFLLALAAIRLFCSFFNNRIALTMVTVGLFVVEMCLSKMSIILPFALDSAMLALPFFVIGYLASSYLKIPYSVFEYFLLFIVSAFLVILLGAHNGIVDINHNLFGNNGFVFIVVGVVGTLMVFSFSRLITKIPPPAIIVRFVDIYAKGLLLIVGFSPRLNSLYRDAVLRLFPDDNTGGVISWLSIGILVFVSFLPLIIICQKYFPAILGLRRRE